jgi:hypothetical protein
MGLCSYIGIFEGEFRASMLMYYTIQSNILALGLFIGLSLRTAFAIRNDGIKGSAGYAPRFELVCTIDLLLTLVVFWVMLAPSMFTMGETSILATYENYQVHLLTPLFCLIDWVLFAPSRSLRFRDLFLIYVYPYCYVIFTSLAGVLGYVYRYGADGSAMHYPYFFFDYDLVGWYALLYIAGLSVFFFVLGCLFYLFDRKVKKPRLFAGPTFCRR